MFETETVPDWDGKSVRTVVILGTSVQSCPGQGEPSDGRDGLLPLLVPESSDPVRTN